MTNETDQEATNETDQEAPESVLDQIMAKAARLPGATELHAMIGSLSHQLSRAETALTELAAHARRQEAEAAAHAHEIHVRDTEKIQLNRRIDYLEHQVEKLIDRLSEVMTTQTPESAAPAPVEVATETPA